MGARLQAKSGRCWGVIGWLVVKEEKGGRPSRDCVGGVGRMVWGGKRKAAGQGGLVFEEYEGWW